MSTAEVVGAGWHDTYFRWDISTPQRVVSRLGELPGQGDITRPGKKLYADRDRFGKWQHLLGPENVMLSYTIHARKKEVIRRLEVQAHLGESGEDDLCSPSSFDSRFRRLQAFMAMIGVLPPEEPVCVRIDTAVDVLYGDTGEAQLVLEALRFARWPGQWYAEWQGSPPYTTVAIKKGRHTVGRVYCRNTKLRNGGPRWGKLRFESEHRFEWRKARPVGELRTEKAAGVYWGAVFGQDRPAGTVTRIEREDQNEAGRACSARRDHNVTVRATHRVPRCRKAGTDRPCLQTGDGASASGARPRTRYLPGGRGDRTAGRES